MYLLAELMQPVTATQRQLAANRLAANLTSPVNEIQQRRGRFDIKMAIAADEIYSGDNLANGGNVVGHFDRMLPFPGLAPWLSLTPIILTWSHFAVPIRKTTSQMPYRCRHDNPPFPVSI